MAALPLFITLASAQEPLETKSAGETKLRAIVDDRFEVRKTEHFIIAHDCLLSVLRPHVGRLEGTYDAVLRFMNGCGLTPTTMPTDLPIIFYDQFQDFAAYARTMGMRPREVAGFYHTGNGVAAFMNTANAPNLKPINDEIARAENSLESLTRSGGAFADRRVVSLQANIALWRRQRDRLAEQYNRFVLQHEAAHQILFTTGAHARDAQNPQWLIEGLACQFEVPQTQPRGKLTGINHVRLGDLREALGVPPGRTNPGEKLPRFKTDQLLPLSTLVLDSRAFSRASIDLTTLYAQSWALVFYLHRQFPEPFAEYLKNISQRQPDDEISADQELKAFIAAFGKPDEAFLRNFLAWILTLRFDPQAAGR